MTRVSKTTIDAIECCISSLGIAQKLLAWEAYKMAQDVTIDDVSEQTVIDIALEYDLPCGDVYEILSDESQETPKHSASKGKSRSIWDSGLTYFDPYVVD